MKARSIIALLSSAAAATASYTGNLNYRSPSENHPSLGIAIHKVARRAQPNTHHEPSELKFTHGIASGDPYHDSVILWTRVAPTKETDRSNVTVSKDVELFTHENEEFVKKSKNPICVKWKISEKENLKSVADEGTIYTSSDIDYTVKVEARGLKPFTKYYYQFNICNSHTKSPVGRTKTTPRADDDLEELKLAVYSCANYPAGFFNSYGNVARKDSVDFVVHLGDYIYEYGNEFYGDGTDIDRIPQPNKEIYSLYDYRKRHATYRTDSDLLASHKKFAWIPVWDDHDFQDNIYNDGSTGMNNTEDSFVRNGEITFKQRKMNAVRAYFEWLPIRQVEMDDNLRIWRTFRIGKLVDLIMLDTRAYDRDVTLLDWNDDYVLSIIDDPNRSLMGARQEKWFYRQLKESAKRRAAWRLIGTQVLIAHLAQPKAAGGSDPMSADTWDGYRANRNRTLRALYDNDIGDNIFIAGDSHSSWVSDVFWEGEKKYNPKTGKGAIGVEFGGTAVSSPGMDGSVKELTKSADQFVAANKGLQWSEFAYRGYMELRVRPDYVDTEYFGIADARVDNGIEVSLANFTVKHGTNSLKRPIAGGKVEAGSAQGGKRENKNIGFDTKKRKYVKIKS